MKSESEARSRAAKLPIAWLCGLVLLQPAIMGAAAEAPPAEREPAAEASAETAEPATEPTQPSTSPAAPAEPTPSPAAPGRDAQRNRAERTSPERFQPSEQVRADFDVSFPVDI